MNKFLLFLIISIFSQSLFAQKVDSIYFHLYTDSLKKGQYNYINVDGKLSNGRWLPLTDKDVIFTCNEAAFEGNELVLPENFSEKKVIVKATLRSNPLIRIERTIWVKQQIDPPLRNRQQMSGDRNNKRYQ